MFIAGVEDAAVDPDGYDIEVTRIDALLILRIVDHADR